MDDATARALIALNNRFYAEHAASFSATRTAPWEGWRRVADELRDAGWDQARGADGSPASEAAGRDGNKTRTVLDLACGNLRFERFLTEALPGTRLAFHAVDACDELAQTAAATPEAPGEPCAAETPAASDTCGTLPASTYHHLDILDALLGNDVLPLPDVPRCDLAVCFGFLHHVPGMRLRRALLDALIEHTVPGGIIALSCWQFMDDGRLARKAAAADRAAREHPPYPGIEIAELDQDDHFLGWQQDPAPLRFCHHASEAEVDALAAYAAPRARERARFSADGATGALNRYLLLQRA